MIRLDDQVAIITGSGRGLGAAYAHLLAARGAQVVIHDAGVNKEGTDSDPTVAADVASKIREAGGVAIAKTRMWNIQDEPKDLRPEQVAPGVLYLASPECQESGFIVRASNGQFTAARWIERDNVDYPLNLAAVESATAEKLVTQWHKVASEVAF